MVAIKMPQVSQTTDEVRLVRWLVKEGDEVMRGTPLCEVETDKTTMEVESFENGTVLGLVAGNDTTVEAGNIIAYIGKPGEVAPEAGSETVSKRIKPDPAEPAPRTGRETGEERPDDAVLPLRNTFGAEVNASSIVKQIALKRGIRLEQVRGTGPGGRITKADLEEYMRNGEKDGIKLRREDIPLSPLQVAVGRNMLRSKREIPHYYLKIRLHMDRFLSWRSEKYNREGTKIAIDALFVYAVSRALRLYPRLNASFRDTGIRTANAINVGFAAAAGEDLHVPVIRNADGLSIDEIDEEVKRLAELVKNGQIKTAETTGGTFTVTNLGMFGIEEFCAIINPPQAGVLAVGGIRRGIAVDGEDRVSPCTVCIATGSFDHRLVNGALASQFLGAVRKSIEEGWKSNG